MRRQRATTTTKKEREIKCKRQMEITFHLLKKMKMDTKERNEQLKKNIVDGEDVLHEREMIILLCASPVVFLHIFFFFLCKNICKSATQFPISCYKQFCIYVCFSEIFYFSCFSLLFQLNSILVSSDDLLSNNFHRFDVTT